MLGWSSNFVMALSILLSFTSSQLFLWKEVILRLQTIFTKYSLKVWASFSSLVITSFFFYQGYSFSYLIFSTKYKLYIFAKLLIAIDVRHFKVSVILLFSFLLVKLRINLFVYYASVYSHVSKVLKIGFNFDLCKMAILRSWVVCL